MQVLLDLGYKYDKSKGGVSPNFVLRDEHGKEIDRVIVKNPKDLENQGYWRRDGGKGDLIDLIRENLTAFRVTGRNDVDTLNKVLASYLGKEDNESRPRPKIMIERPFMNTSAWVYAPTVRPIRVVTTSMSGPRAVSAKRRVTPDSLSRLPKNSMPSRGRPEGTIKAVQIKPMIGKIIFSFWLTARGLAMCMQRSFLLVRSSIIGF